MTHPSLFILGAGPKAMAIAAKATVLDRFGYQTPEIHIVEKSGVGAHWNGRGGYTNGKMELGTSPEKDVGFPYQTCLRGKKLPEVDQELRAFSWQAFLVDQGTFASWVDRGRPSPTHALWAEYLAWISLKLGPRVHLHHGTVNGLRLTQARWEVRFSTSTGDRTLFADGVVLTGPGHKRLSEEANPRLFDVETFWENLPEIAAKKHRVGIVGAGENAASMAMALHQSAREGVEIDIISPSGFAFSRGESFRENHVYSDPSFAKWESLSLATRREFIRRTDLGVFSQYALKYLDRCDDVQIVLGRLVGTRNSKDKIHALLSEESPGPTRAYDYLVVATGFDPAETLRGLLDWNSAERLKALVGISEITVSELECRIETDLSLAGLKPRLHLPALAGLAQGPGFSNLSSLGRLADRTLETYVHRKEIYEFHTSTHPGLCLAGK